MRMRGITLAFLLAGTIALCNAKASAQTDASVSLFGAFTGSTNGNGTAQSPSNAAGGLFELRHISNPLIGYEGTYSFNRDNQVYKFKVCPAGLVISCSTTAPISANAHQITGDWIMSFKVAKVRGFALAGLGIMFDAPVSPLRDLNTVTRPSTEAVYVYGAGVDWKVAPHVGLRMQYRGTLYKAPNLAEGYTSTNTLMHTAEPMIGAYFRF